MFRVPSSSPPPPPSTPDYRRQSANGPSTTPAGPPPTGFTAASYTPVGLPPSSVFGSSQLHTTYMESLMDTGSPRGTKRSRYGDSQTQSPPRQSQSPKYDMLALAKGLAASSPPIMLHESNRLVMETEELMGRLSEDTKAGNAVRFGDGFSAIAEGLRSLWKSEVPQTIPQGPPEVKDPPVAKAEFVARLLLELHHPSGTEMPKVLLDWLNRCHTPCYDLDKLLRARGDYSADPLFWENVNTSVFRGRFNDALQLLKGANFSVAASAMNDGHDETGYYGQQLHHTKEAVGQLVSVIEACPAYRSNDWDIKGAEWALYRRDVSAAIEQLKEFAEGDTQDSRSPSQRFDASNFGLSTASQGFSYSTASRRAESKVPWTVYSNLIAVYSQLICSPEEVIQNSMDWVEATIGLAVWWDGEDEVPKGSLAGSRLSLSRSQRTRVVDVTPAAAYRQKLAQSLATVTHLQEEQLAINTTNSVEVCLACVMEGNIEGAVRLLSSWSMAITSAVVELASAAAWLEGSLSRSPSGFDKSDLMVLSYGHQTRSGIKKDDVLAQYAELLREREEVRHGRKSQAGWEMAIQVLCRMDNKEDATSRINSILDTVELDSDERVNGVIRLCYELQLSEQARTIADRYGDSLRDANNFGDAIVYYARAHDEEKLRTVLGVLSSFCLVHSVAYPPPSELDDHLKAFIISPKASIDQIWHLDSEAAELLSTHLSGYATLRKFYELRDEEVNLKPGEKPAHRRNERRRAAAAALMALISSASASIRGGLYDPSDETVVQVDGLLALLGEALPFIKQKPRSLSVSDLRTLLAVIEDFDTTPTPIRYQCEDFLSSTISAISAHPGSGSEIPSLRASMLQLKKSTSNLTASSYDLVGSSVLGSGESSGVLIKGPVKREWDWRRGCQGQQPSGAALCRMLRVAIAEELAERWDEEGLEE